MDAKGRLLSLRPPKHQHAHLARTHAPAHTHTHLEMICPRLVLQIEQYIYLITEGNPTEPLATARPSVSPRQATPRQMDVNKVAIEEFIRLLPH